MPGQSDEAGTSITGYPQRYADQNERDCRAFAKGDPIGRLQAIEGAERLQGGSFHA